ncbi:hypothetical protein LINGRAHAP2_LOCUS18801 [Linum grandiflorum]
MLQISSPILGTRFLRNCT